MRTREEVKADFSAGLKEFMRRKGLTFRELSRNIGVSTTNILDWKNGASAPSLVAVANLVALGMRLEEVFGKEFCKLHFRPKGAPRMNDADFGAYDVMEYGLLAMLEKIRNDRDGASE